MREIFLLIFWSLLISSVSSLKCREKSFKGEHGCTLKNVDIASNSSEVNIESTEKTVKALKVEHERLRFLPETFLKSFPEIKILHLVKVELMAIDEWTFKQTKLLQDVNLEGNNLTTLPSGTFDDLQDLKTLNLANNKIAEISSNLFAKNRQLESLTLKGNEILRIPGNTFTSLIRLKFLDLSMNKINELKESIFSNNEALTTIDLSNNELAVIGIDTFTPTKNLVNLNLEKNSCDIKNSWFTVNERTVNFDKIRHELSECEPWPFHGCEEDNEEVKNRTLWLRNQLITVKKNNNKEFNAMVEHKAKLNFELTDKIDQTKNFRHVLTMAGRKVKFWENKKQEINQMRAELSRIIEADIPYDVDLTNLEHENGKLERHVDQLKLSTSDQRFLNFDIFCDKPDHPVCEVEGLATPYDQMKIATSPSSSVTVLTVSKSVITFLPSDVFVKLQNLKKLNISASFVHHLKSGTFTMAKNLQHLELTENKITDLPEKCFEGAENLQILRLKGNRIETLSSGTFNGLINLRELDLNSNQIKEIPRNAFNDLANLENLILSNNQIHHLNGDILKLNVNLEGLAFNGNPISSVGEQLIDNCPNIVEVYYGKTKCFAEESNSKDVEAFKLAIKSGCDV